MLQVDWPLFIWCWWRQLADARILKFASCRGGWGAHAMKRPNLISRYSKQRWQNEAVRSGLWCSEKGSAARKSLRTTSLTDNLRTTSLHRVLLFESECGLEKYWKRLKGSVNQRFEKYLEKDTKPFYLGKKSKAQCFQQNLVLLITFHRMVFSTLKHAWDKRRCLRKTDMLKMWWF